MASRNGIHSRLVWAEKVQVWACTLSHKMCPRKQATNQNCWFGIIFLKRSYLVHWCQLLFPHIVASMPFRFFWATPYTCRCDLFYPDLILLTSNCPLNDKVGFTFKNREFWPDILKHSPMGHAVSRNLVRNINTVTMETQKHSVSLSAHSISLKLQLNFFQTSITLLTLWIQKWNVHFNSFNNKI